MAKRKINPIEMMEEPCRTLATIHGVSTTILDAKMEEGHYRKIRNNKICERLLLGSLEFIKREELVKNAGK